MITLIHSTLLAAIVNPGQGTAPPGSDKFTTIIKWGAWGVFAVAVLAVLVSAGKMMFAHRGGGLSSDHTASLAYTLVAVVIAGFATAIVQALA